MNHTEIESIITRLIDSGVTHEDYSQISEAVNEIMKIMPHWIPIEEAELEARRKYDIFTITGKKHVRMYYTDSATMPSCFYDLDLKIKSKHVTHVMKSIPDPV